MLTPALPDTRSGGVREARIDQLMEQILRDRACSTSLECEELERAHSDLMPEFGERLKTLRAIAAAGARATQRPSSDADIAEPHVAFAEDVEFLREALADYEVLEPLRYGGQGVVYKAIQRGAERHVAIKMLLDGPLATPRQRRRFERETELSARLDHPHIVRLYDSGVVRGRPFFAMQYVEGVPIDDFVLANRASVSDVVGLMARVCRAVSYAHQNGVVHRDLNPANILVDLEGQPHILDFGLAKDLWAEDDDKALSRTSITGGVVGTLPYLSPEQARGSDKLDIRTDIYSLGVTLYELLAGRSPYTFLTNDELRRAIESQTPVGLRTAVRDGSAALRPSGAISRDLETVVARALAKSPDERYQSAAALADDLERCLRGDAVEARADSRLYQLRKALRRNRIAVSVAAAFLLLLSGSLVAVTVSWARAEQVARNAQTVLQAGGFLQFAVAARDAGRLDQGLGLVNEAIELGKRLSPDAPYAREMLYKGYLYSGRMHLNEKRLDLAESAATEAARLAQAMADDHPEDKLARLFAARAVALRAEVEYLRTNYTDAQKAFRNALAMVESLSASDLQDTTILHETAFLRQRLGDSANKCNDDVAALAEYSAASATFTDLARRDPANVGYQLDLATLQNQCARVHADRRDEKSLADALMLICAARDRVKALPKEVREISHRRQVDFLTTALDKNQRVYNARLQKALGKLYSPREPE